MSEIYLDGNYLRKNPTWHQEDSRWKADQVLKILARNNLAPKRVCEVGTGAGGILRALAEDLPETNFTGFEISEAAYEIASRHDHPRIRLVNGDAFTSGERFDLVMAIDVIEHVEDLFTFLRKMRSLADYQIYHIPLDLSAQSVLRGNALMAKRSQVGHIHYFTKDTALACLRDTGHTVVDYFYTPSANELYPGPMSAALRPVRKVLFRAAPDLATRLLGGYSLLALCR